MEPQKPSPKEEKTLVQNLSSSGKYDPNITPEMLPPNPDSQLSGDAKKTRDALEELKKKILKKFPFTRALGILPAYASQMIEEDEAVPQEICATKPLHMIMLIPEEEYKNIPKIKPDVVQFAKESKENIWVHIKTTEVDVWNYGLDSKFEFVDAIAMSYPLHDNGFLGAMRVAILHKNLVLNWLNTGRVKYVATYAIGGSLVRGTADKTSDVDTFVIIDDTDVKRMSRIELLEKLRGKIVYDFLKEATALAGVQNILNVQVYLLTDFWQSVKDAQPVMFTFIRDGIPLYDRGTFIPWKRLLQMGKIRPSPESIDLYMKEGDRTDEIVKRRLLDAMVDVYYGVLTPTQALMMLAGHAPPVPKTVVQEVREALVQKEKIMTEKDLKTLEKAVKYFKDYEHGTLKEVSGKEIDALLEECRAYTKRMKEVRTKLESKVQQHQVEKIVSESFSLIEKILSTKSQETSLKALEQKLVKPGKIPERMLDIAEEISKLKAKTAKKPLTSTEMQRITRDASDLMNSLTEYTQRLDLAVAEKGLFQISCNGKKAEIVLTSKGIFVVESEKSIRKLQNNHLVESNKEELEQALAESKQNPREKLSSQVIEAIKKELGEFEFVL